MAPELSKIGNENPFSTPEGYFDSFSERMQERLEKEEMKSSHIKKASLIQLLKPYIAMAAIFVGAFVLIYIPANNIVNKNKTVGFDASTYVEDQMDWSSVFELVSSGSENEEEEVTDQLEIEEYMVASVSDFDIYFE